MTVFIMELAAMGTMLVDHIGFTFSLSKIFRMIGRVAFPLYAFMVVNSYNHVREKEGGAKNYLFRLFVLALLSEIPYDLMSENVIVDWSSQNQVIQYFIAALVLFLIDRWKDIPLAEPILFVGAAIVCAYGGIGYYASGILLVFFYKVYFDRFYEKEYAWRQLYLLLTTLIFVFFEWLEIHWDAGIEPRVLFTHLDVYFPWFLRNTCACVGMFLAAAYQGKQGFHSRWYKAFYRAFYPVHMLLLWAIRALC